MLPEKRLIRSWPKGDRPRPVCSGLPAVPRCPPGQFHGCLEPSGARHPLCLPEGGAFLPPDLRHSPGPRLGSPQTPLPRDGTPLPSGPQQPGQGGRLIPLQWAVGQDRPQPCRTFRLFRPLPGLQNRPCLSGSRLPLLLCFDPVFPIPGRLFGPGASLRLRRAARLRRALRPAGAGAGPPSCRSAQGLSACAKFPPLLYPYRPRNSTIPPCSMSFSPNQISVFVHIVQKNLPARQNSPHIAKSKISAKNPIDFRR